MPILSRVIDESKNRLSSDIREAPCPSGILENFGYKKQSGEQVQVVIITGTDILFGTSRSES
jgi:hypothetical protein